MPEETNKEEKPPRRLFECIKCHYKWYGKRDVATIRNGAQCPDCNSYSLICHERFDEDLKEFKTKFGTKEEFEKFMDNMEWLKEHRFLLNNETHELVFQHLIKNWKIHKFYRDKKRRNYACDASAWNSNL